MKKPLRPDSNENNPRATIQEIPHPLQQSARVFRRVLNEYDEQKFLNEHVRTPCIELGLISDKSNAGSTSLLFGKPTVKIECKASHNLLIPNQFRDKEDV
jgi:hypothetical protein